jgi:uncharacterized membrane protein
MFKAKNTAVILVIVLLVGGMVGYAASYLSLRPIISSQDDKIAQLTYAVSMLNSTVHELQAYVSLSNSTIQLMSETIDGLEALATAKPGYVRSNLYSLSVQYLQGMNVTVSGLLHPTADAGSGRITGMGEGYETFEATWLATSAQPGLEESLDAGIAPLMRYNITLGDKVHTTVQGHRALYQTYSIRVQNETAFYGAMAVWYCDRSQTFIIFSLTTGGPYAVLFMNDYLSGIYCHIP